MENVALVATSALPAYYLELQTESCLLVDKQGIAKLVADLRCQLINRSERVRMRDTLQRNSVHRFQNANIQKAILWKADIVWVIDNRLLRYAAQFKKDISRRMRSARSSNSEVHNEKNYENNTLRYAVKVQTNETRYIICNKFK